MGVCGGHVIVQRCTGHAAPLLHRGGEFCSQSIMKLWASLLPEGTVLYADSFFGAHGRTTEWATSKRAFLIMTNSSTYGVTWPGEQVTF